MPMRESVQRPKSRKRVMLACRAMCVERGATGVGRSDQGADAGAGNVIDGDFILFQDAQNADVRDAAGKSAAESDADFRAFARAVRKGPQAANGFSQPFCGGSRFSHRKSLTNTVTHFALRGVAG